MELSKRPKGNEIEAYVADVARSIWATHETWGGLKHPRVFESIHALRRDLDLLMAHLKLEFQGVPGTPAKRVVGKATKKKGPNVGCSGPTFTSLDLVQFVK